MITKLLGRIGLSDKETTIYMASLEVGLQPASVIARKVHMNRVTAYQILRKLVEKGLAFTMVRGGVNYFSVEEPKHLEAYIAKKQQVLETTKQKLLEKIQTLSERSTLEIAIPKVRYYDGLDGVKAVYDDIQRSGTFFHMLSPGDSIPEDLYYHLQYNFYPQLQRNHVNFDMVSSAPKDILMSLGAYDFVGSRIFLVDQLEQDVEVVLYGETKVAFINYVQDMHGVVIEDTFIYRALKFHMQVLKQFYEKYRVA